MALPRSAVAFVHFDLGWCCGSETSPVPGPDSNALLLGDSTPAEARFLVDSIWGLRYTAGLLTGAQICIHSTLGTIEWGMILYAYHSLRFFYFYFFVFFTMEPKSIDCFMHLGLVGSSFIFV